jgi:hypothetical protein
MMCEYPRGAVDEFVSHFGRVVTEELGVPVRGFFGRCTGFNGRKSGWCMVIRVDDGIDEGRIRGVVEAKFGSGWSSLAGDIYIGFPSLHMWEQITEGAGVVVGLKPDCCRV